MYSLCRFVYVLSAPKAGLLKVGCSVAPGFRATSSAIIRQVGGERPVLVGVMRGAFRAERRIHKKLSAWRVRGEWFLDCPESREILVRFMPFAFGPIALLALRKAHLPYGAVSRVALDAGCAISKVSAVLSGKARDREVEAQLARLMRTDAGARVSVTDAFGPRARCLPRRALLVEAVA